MVRYEFSPVENNDGMISHPTPRVRDAAWYAPPTNWAETAREADPDWPAVALDGVWLLDGQHPGPTDEEVMRPIIDAAMREDNER